MPPTGVATSLIYPFPKRSPDPALDCLRLGVDLPRGGLLIHGLVGMAIQAIGLKAMEEAVDGLDGPTAAAGAMACRSG